MQRIRRGIIGLGLLLLLAGGAAWWRAAHPPLSPEQQIAAALDDASQALEARSPRRVLAYLTPEFKWNNTSREELSNLLRGTAFQWRDVRLQRFNERIEVNGDSATSSGSYSLTYRNGPQAAPETQNGNYILRWQLRDGEWKIVAATGGDSRQN